MTGVRVGGGGGVSGCWRQVSPSPPQRKVYRGLGGMKLPEQFWKLGQDGAAAKVRLQGGQGAPCAAKVRLQGGVELGLMSTTANRDIALQYSGAGQGKLATILEAEVGRIDGGGQLGLLSQYPGEEEYLLGPYACLEVMARPRAETTPQGQVRREGGRERGRAGLHSRLRRSSSFFFVLSSHFFSLASCLWLPLFLICMGMGV